MEVELLISDDTESFEKDELFYDCTTAVLGSLSPIKFESCEISLLLTGDERIHELNKEYREKDKPTDVLSFAMSDDPMNEGGMLGDIVISMDTAKSQADEAAIHIERELAFLFIHGLLHLLGFDHSDYPDEEEEMYLIQEDILKKLIKDGKVP